MHQKSPSKIPKYFFTLLNNLYDIERKARKSEDITKIKRNIQRMKDAFRKELYFQEPDTGLYYEDPMGQSYDETRNDLDASIAGEETENLIVVDVIKPIIRYGSDKFSTVVQKGVVVVESNKGKKEELQ